MLISFSELIKTSSHTSIEHEHAISSASRKRGTAKASLKRLDGHVTDLEARGELTIDDTPSSQQMLQ